jgi:DNA-binding NarL/FixJ family response regulator
MRALIVDDNRMFLQAAQTLLEREGMIVIGTATNRSECLQRAAELRPDVVLLDIDLGDESGFDVAGELTTNAACPAIIFISTHEGPEFADLAAASGGVGFLPKSTLSKQAIQQLLDRPPPS